MATTPQHGTAAEEEEDIVDADPAPLDRGLSQTATQINSAIQTDMQNLGARIEAIELKTDHTVARVNQNTARIQDLQDQLDTALSKIDDLENRSRRYNFRIRCLPESVKDVDSAVMEKMNMTRISTIHLLGFQTSQIVKHVLFFILLMLYCVTICGNLLIITLVSYSKILQSPMYIFLSQLAMSDILMASDILPNMFQTLLVNDTIMSFSGCLSQFYFFCVTVILDSLLLTVMSYDRYLAICKPLHYSLMMNHHRCCTLVIFCWSSSCLTMLMHTLNVAHLQFCGPNIVDHFFCDLDPILKLSCSDIAIIQIEITLLTVLFDVIPFFFVILSYIIIIVTILKIPSITGRQQVFSTCSSHLAVVCIYYGNLACAYLVPSRGQSANMTKFLSLSYTVLTPLINPLIYTLRNKDLKKFVYMNE
ncbi:olfactory receptor 1496-like [Aquarana catesbeiana]|uniref:olfactory receptor 1496-like n=1 Tax=Aquarana catesbeiana TaxID=8400 RepID=UPI003CC9582B